MIHRLINSLHRLSKSPYAQRLKDRSWVFGLVFLTQLLLSGYASYSSYNIGVTSLERVLSLIPYMIVHSGGWAVALWGIMAWPRKRIPSVLLGGLLLAIIVGFYMIEAILLQEYHTLYNVDLALLLLSTSTREAKESFSILHASSFVWSIVGLLLASLGGYLIGRWIKRCHFYHVVWGALLLLIGGGGVILPFAYQHLDSRVIPSSYTTSYERAILSTTYGYLLSKKVEKRYAAMSRLEGLESLTVESSPFDEPIDIVFVLGESTRRDYMHCYGYPLPNTPGIDSLLADSSLILFKDVTAPATTTNYSCQRTLTYYTNGEGTKEWYDYPNLLGTLQRAGWATAWVTNQETTGIYAASRIFSPFADVLRECHGGASGKLDTSEHALDDLGGAYDTSVLPLLQTYSGLPDSLRQKKPRGLFEVVHLMGAHFDYAKRFPPSFARLRPQDLPRKLDNKKGQVVANYVNCVYFTDYVFTEIVKRYAHRPTLVFFLSDHGEILYDNPKEPNYYGHNPYMITPGAIEVPFLVYLSPSLKAKYPAVQKLFSRAKDLRISADLLTHTLTSFLGIRTRYTDPRLDFLSPGYDPQRKRMVTATEAESFEVD